MCNRGKPIAEADDLALLCKANPACKRTLRLAGNRLVRTSTTTTYRSASPVEQPHPDAMLATRICETRLCILQSPVRGDKSAILARVRIPKHDLLEVAHHIKVTAVFFDRKQLIQQHR